MSFLTFCWPLGLASRPVLPPWHPPDQASASGLSVCLLKPCSAVCLGSPHPQDIPTPHTCLVCLSSRCTGCPVFAAANTAAHLHVQAHWYRFRITSPVGQWACSRSVFPLRTLNMEKH